MVSEGVIPLRVLQAIERMGELRFLLPDSEADAAGPAFEAFVRDRLDEFHAALECAVALKDQPFQQSFSREVRITRSGRDLLQWSQEQPLSARFEVLGQWLLRQCLPRHTVVEDAAIALLRQRLEPLFRQSEEWQEVVAWLPLTNGVPWIVHLCAEAVALCRQHESQSHDPLPWSPLVALWCRGVWPMPTGDGGLAVWIPQSKLGALGVYHEFRTWGAYLPAISACGRVGFLPPESFRRVNQARFFGWEQTINLDLTPALVIDAPPPVIEEPKTDGFEMLINPPPPGAQRFVPRPPDEVRGRRRRRRRK